MGLELPWYAEMKREQGAFATLLGLAVLPPTADRPGKWRAVAVGDSCLVRVRDGRHAASFPMRKAADFGNQPRLIGSRGGPTPTPEHAAGSLPAGRPPVADDRRPGPVVSAQLTKRAAGPGRPWRRCCPPSEPDEAFAAWIEELRDRDSGCATTT